MYTTNKCKICGIEGDFIRQVEYASEPEHLDYLCDNCSNWHIYMGFLKPKPTCEPCLLCGDYTCSPDEVVCSDCINNRE